MKKNVRAKDVVITAIVGLIGVAALSCIIISMVTGKVTPYLALGLGLGATGNAIGLMNNRGMKGNNNGSCKDGSIS